jgi:acetyl/propionyl-CoA carboxylase alpha subunit/acetyl-CoA carboxylase carboxyltransferase component
MRASPAGALRPREASIIASPTPTARPFRSVLIANRGEVAVRIARAAAELGLRTVAVCSRDDAASPHAWAADERVELAGSGPAAYLDIDAMVAVAVRTGCEAVHPGYGFLSENAAFGRRCLDAGLVFVGPSPDVLELFGDKLRARAFARSLGVAVLPGTEGPCTLEQAAAFLAGLGAGGKAMIKAVAGGGGRGMRAVDSLTALQAAYPRCRSEAQSAFGLPDVYLEALVDRARHVEVQILGDGTAVAHLGERDCSLQHRHQKLVEIAPSPWLPSGLRDALQQAALRLARASGYRGVGTMEFLFGESLPGGASEGYAFIEANPRLQVEHTVTEAVTGVDLVQTQLRLAMGETLEELGLDEGRAPAPRGCAIQYRITMDPVVAQPELAGSGCLDAFDLPGGPGVRVDSFGCVGYAPSPQFDALLAKLVVSAGSFEAAARRGQRALGEFRIAGVSHNLRFLRNLACHAELLAGRIDTTFIDRHRDTLAGAQAAAQPDRHAPLPSTPRQAAATGGASTAASGPGDLVAPLRGTVLELAVTVGQPVAAGQALAVLDALKMEHVLEAPAAGRVTEVLVSAGQAVGQGEMLMRIDLDEAIDGQVLQELPDAAEGQPSAPRADLLEVAERHALTFDAARPDAVRRRRRTGQRTARENLDDLCDEGSFLEYGGLAVAGQRSTRSFEDLQRISPADGFIYGLATVNAERFGPVRSRCLVAAYDYTVFAGTQGYIGHKKHDRLLELAASLRVPLVLFAEGGGGRPADSDNIGGVNLANPTFWHFGKLSGSMPLVGIVSGRCFAGNAVLLGCCDVIIATANATVGMGGPAMIEGAGLGVFTPEEVGPAQVHERSGAVDVLVRDEAEAVAVARRYLGYFQGPLADWTAADPTLLREVIPTRRTRAYDVRRVIDLLMDTDSVLELRPRFGGAAVTALARLEGRPVGVIASNPMVNAGALGSDESDKLARFMQLCDGFDLPIVSLCDTPGFMVGPQAETTAQIRHCSRIFVTAANVTVPILTVILRKAYGLGGQAMAGGSFHKSSMMTVAWPTAEFGSMGLEGQIRLGYRAELEAIADPAARQARYQALVDGLYQRGKAVNVAPFLSIDDVIDPAQTRRWLVAGLQSYPPPPPREGRKRPHIDAW